LTSKSPDESWPTHFSLIKLIQASNENNFRFIALHFPQWYADHVNGRMDDWWYFQNPIFTQNVNGVPIVQRTASLLCSQEDISTMTTTDVEQFIEHKENLQSSMVLMLLSITFSLGATFGF